jgi:tRNA(fMet)-specific endonuclease VapC
MSLYILDTDILTLLQKKHPAVVQRVAGHDPSELAVTIISVEEQLSGWYTQLRRAKKRDALARVYLYLTRNVQSLALLQILSFTEAAIFRYERLKSLKLGVGKKDLCIAAITLETAATLVTRNMADFRKVPYLPLENWAES